MDTTVNLHGSEASRRLKLQVALVRTKLLAGSVGHETPIAYLFHLMDLCRADVFYVSPQFCERYEASLLRGERVSKYYDGNLGNLVLTFRGRRVYREPMLSGLDVVAVEKEL